MASSSSTEQHSLMQMAAIAALLAVLVLASFLGLWLFVLVMIGLVGLASRLLAQGMGLPQDLSVVATVLAAVFLPAAAVWGDHAPAGAAAVVMWLTAAFMIARGEVKGAISSTSAVVLTALYMGLLTSFIVIVRRDLGPELVAVFALMVIGYRAGRWAAEQRFAGSGDLPSWAGVVAGLGLTILGGLASLLILPDNYSAGPLVALGLIVGFAALIGDLTRSVVSTGVDSERFPLLFSASVMLIQAIGLTAPAFFFGFRLYLT